jgi:hypothetical protein
LKQSSTDIVCSDVDYTSTVYTDEYAADDQLRIRYGFRHEQVNHSQREYTRRCVIFMSEAITSKYGIIYVIDLTFH